jgi:hypothetical protein
VFGGNFDGADETEVHRHIGGLFSLSVAVVFSVGGGEESVCR